MGVVASPVGEVQTYPVVGPADQVKIEIAVVNVAPVLAPIGAQGYTELDTVNIAVNATDSNGDLLSVEVSGLPTALSFIVDYAASGQIQGTIQGVLSTSAAGSYNVNVRVIDEGSGNLTDEETFTLSVAEYNYPPVLNTISDFQTREGDTPTAIQISTSAQDSDNLSIAAYLVSAGTEKALPNFATLSVGTQSGTSLNGQISIDTTAGDAGGYTFRVRVTDDFASAASDEQDFVVSVNSNAAPQIFMPASQTQLLLVSTSAFISIDDAEGDTATISKQSGPAWVSVTDNADNTGAVKGYPPANITASSYPVVIRAVDNGPIPATTDSTIIYQVTRDHVFKSNTSGEWYIDAALYNAVVTGSVAPAWTLSANASAAYAGYAMEVSGGTGILSGASLSADASYMSFQISTNVSGSVYTYFRGRDMGTANANDSVHIEILGVAGPAAANFDADFTSTMSWNGNGDFLNGTNLQPGRYEFRVWRREVTVAIDRIAITRGSVAWSAGEIGPAPSGRAAIGGVAATGHVPDEHLPDEHLPDESQPV